MPAYMYNGFGQSRKLSIERRSVSRETLQYLKGVSPGGIHGVGELIEVKYNAKAESHNENVARKMDIRDMGSSCFSLRFLNCTIDEGIGGSCLCHDESHIRRQVDKAAAAS